MVVQVRDVAGEETGVEVQVMGVGAGVDGRGDIGDGSGGGGDRCVGTVEELNRERRQVWWYRLGVRQLQVRSKWEQVRCGGAR